MGEGGRGGMGGNGIEECYGRGRKVVESGAEVAGGEEGRLVEGEERGRKASWGWVSASLP